MKRVLFTILFAMMALLASGTMMSGALAAPQEMDLGALVSIELSEETASYTFTPTVNGEYSLYVYPVSDVLSAEAELRQDDTLLATGAGSMKLFSCRLSAGVTYEIRLTGQGSGQFEIARETLSRCYDLPIELDDGGSYSKSIARTGDAHWYSILAESDGAAILAASARSRDLSVRMWLYDDQGRQIASGETLPSGAAVLSTEMTEGTTYYVRVAGSDGQTGQYTLSVLRDAETAGAEAVSLSSSEIALEGRSIQTLEVQIEPEGSCGLYYADCADPSVASAGDGYIEGHNAGETTLTIYAYGGARFSSTVTVSYVAVESVSFAEDSMTLSAGDSAVLSAEILPANATDRGIRYEIGDETIAAIEDGTLTALNEGETIMRAVTTDGTLSAELTLTVTAAQRKYRAVFIGEQNYASTVETEREGSVKSVESVLSAFRTASFDGEGCTATMMMDVSRDTAIQGIRLAFGDAREEDVSIVYITCHGFYQAGMTFFLMADGSVLSAQDLENELSQIPGEIILIADCCGSGGLIGASSEPEDILDGITSVFSGTVGAGAISGSKYKVIASAYLDQDSYRISFDEDGTDVVSTVFARALCDALGWSMDRNARASMNADTDYDGEVTLTELAEYLSRRVSWYLAGSDSERYVQTVCVYPESDPTVVFARLGAE